MSHIAKANFFLTAMAITATLATIVYKPASWLAVERIIPQASTHDTAEVVMSMFAEMPPRLAELPQSSASERQHQNASTSVKSFELPLQWSIANAAFKPTSSPLPSSTPTATTSIASTATTSIASASIASTASASTLTAASAYTDQAIDYLDHLQDCTPFSARLLSVESRILGWDGSNCKVQASLMTHEAFPTALNTQMCWFSRNDLAQLTHANVINAVEQGDLEGLHVLSDNLQQVTQQSCLPN